MFNNTKVTEDRLQGERRELMSEAELVRAPAHRARGRAQSLQVVRRLNMVTPRRPHRRSGAADCTPSVEIQQHTYLHLAIFYLFTALTSGRALHII